MASQLALHDGEIQSDTNPGYGQRKRTGSLIKPRLIVLYFQLGGLEICPASSAEGACGGVVAVEACAFFSSAMLALPVDEGRFVRIPAWVRGAVLLGSARTLEDAPPLERRDEQSCKSLFESLPVDRKSHELFGTEDLG